MNPHSAIRLKTLFAMMNEETRQKFDKYLRGKTLALTASEEECVFVCDIISFFQSQDDISLLEELGVDTE